MKVIVSIFLIFLRLWVGYHILSWIISESFHPELHSLSEIEVYLVVMVFDNWISKSQDNIEFKIVKHEED